MRLRSIYVTLMALLFQVASLGSCVHSSSKSLLQNHDTKLTQPIFLWRATDPKHPRTPGLYLYGTMHVNSIDDGRLDRSVVRALEHSELLMLEIQPGEDETAEFRQQLLGLGLLPPGQKISDHLSPTTSADLEAYMQAAQLTTSLQAKVRRMKPWFASLNLVYMSLQKAGARQEFGSEEQLIILAQAQKKKILGLETAAAQLQLISSGDAVEQEFQLKQTLLELKAMAAEDEKLQPHAADPTRELLDAYRNGDYDQLYSYAQKLASDVESQNFYRRFLVERNESMVRHIRKLGTDQRSVFVAVGALHLIGPSSVLEGLKKQGYRVERLHASGKVKEIYLPLVDDGETPR